MDIDKLLLKVLLVIAAFCLPPLCLVIAKKGVGEIALNVLLCFFCWIPAVIHGLIVTVQYDGEAESGQGDSD